MKTILLFASLLVAGVLYGTNVTYTNINGMVLGLQFPTTNLVAGERLMGTMIISNASQSSVSVHWLLDNQRDAGIGDFFVTDESGQTLPRTVLAYYMQAGVRPDRTEPLTPGSTLTFEGDVVWAYSLTNPGNYLIKAVAQVPLTNTTPVETFRAETPWIAIAVSQRPDGSPPAKHVYADYYEMLDRMAPAERAVFEKEQERAAAFRAQMQRVPKPRATTRTPSPLNIGTTPASANGLSSADPLVQNKPLSQQSRGFVYAGVVLGGLAALGVLVWRSRARGRSR
jgi:hypothetical protein